VPVVVAGIAATCALLVAFTITTHNRRWAP